MADRDDDVQVRIGADTGELAPKLNTAAKDVKEATGSMREDLNKLGEATTALKGLFMGLSVIMSAATGMAVAITATGVLSDQVKNLATNMGISREEASGLNVALRTIGVSSQEYIAINDKMERQLRRNEDGINKMGVATRTVNGEYLSQSTILQNALQATLQYKEGTDRNLASMVLFGVGFNQASNLLNMNAKVMEESRAIAHAFGVVVGTELEGQFDKLRAATGLLTTLLQGLLATVGQAVMPVIESFTDFLRSNAVPIMEDVHGVVMLVSEVFGLLIEVLSGLWQIVKDSFKAIGELAHEVFGVSIPNDLNVFASVIAAIRIVIQTLRAIAELAFEKIKFAIEEVTGVVKTLIIVWRALQNLDLSGATAAISKGMDEAEARLRKHRQTIAAIIADSDNKVKVIAGGQDENYSNEGRGKTEGGGTRKFVDPNPKRQRHASDKGVLAAQLAEQKAALEADLAATKDNLERAGLLYDQAYAKNQITIREFYAAKLQMDQTAADKAIGVKKAELDNINTQIAAAAAKKTPQGDKEVLQFRTQLIKTTSDLQILEARRAELAVNNSAKMLEAERVAADKIAAIQINAKEKASLNELNNQQLVNNGKYDAQLINNEQLIELERQLENEKTKIQTEAIMARRELEMGGNRDPAAIAELNAQLEALEQQHQSKILEIDIRRNLEANRSWLAVQNTMVGSFNSAVSGLISGTMTLQGAFASMAISLGQVLVSELVTKPLAAKLIAWAQEKIFNVSGVTSAAGVAGAAATASAAAIPMVGWMIAPAAGAAASAAAMAYAPLAAAEQGFDIPAGMNPITQLHQKEMVLPEEHAETLRDMAGNGGGTPRIEYHDHTGTLSRQAIRENVKHIADALKDYARK